MDGAMSMAYRTADETDPGSTERLRHVLEVSLGPHDLQIPDAEPHPATEVEVADVGSLRVTDARVAYHGDNACVVMRSGRHIARDTSSAYRIDIPTSGGIVVLQDGREAAVNAGSLVLTDLSRPAGWQIRATGLTTLLIPPQLLPLQDAQVAMLTARPFEAELGTLVAGLVGRLLALDQAGSTAAPRLSSAIIDLLTVTFTTRLRETIGPGQGTPQQALRARIYAFIEERLGDPALSPATIAAAHHISQRYLYRLFEHEEASVSGWIRRRRLEQANRDLIDPRLRDRSVASIGARWGYSSAAHFIRSFKAEFGRTPGAGRPR
jgi:AraC-like DNA-binding protein